MSAQTCNCISCEIRNREVFSRSEMQGGHERWNPDAPQLVWGGSTASRSSWAPSSEGVSFVTAAPGLLERLRNFEWGGTEVGGYLFGVKRDGQTHLREFLRFDVEERSTARSTLLDLDRGLEALDSMPASLTLVGEWHSHPVNSSTRPSDADVASARSQGEFLQRDWLQLIISPRDDELGWHPPEISVYAVGADGHRALDIVEAAGF